MINLQKFMVVHHDPGVDCSVVQENWRKLTQVEDAKWERTYFNNDQGFRYCVWLAKDEEQLKNIFTAMDVAWESIFPVEETVPDLWGEEWEAHLKADQSADTLGS
ncbi:MAG: DUF4242 domain-containing protein [Desulfobacteraceae bacterium]|nr:DUF4242 domain-containing protein [Desulfobacteraceae bacterium]